ncbi:MAG TPA: cupredoxin domain-containing protein [Mycobacterium sp.]|nr:cupredoxin domain-containing protein [Mycobacterium sp.]
MLGGAALTLSSCSLLPYDGASHKGRLVHGLYIKTAIVALIVLVGVLATLIIELIAFRKRRGDDIEPPQDHGRPAVYASFFVIGLVLIAVLFPFSESVLNKVDDVAKHTDLRLTITGSQWQWAASYEQQGFTVSGKTYKEPMQWELPVNKSVLIDLKSTDVIHGFYMPQFNFSKNAIPGVTNKFSFTPDRLGAYPGQCTQLCGVGHYQMAFVLKVVTADQFAKWVHGEQVEARSGKCGPETNNFTLTAKNISWSAKCLRVHANQPVTVTFKNEDSGIQHNFSIYTGPDAKKNLFKAALLKGPATAVLHVPPMPAGRYYFQCDVHGQAMSGTYLVTG